jgi:hypothetical protein
LATKRATMPPECCGNCKFSLDVRGQTFLLCMAHPPVPMAVQDDEAGFDWVRGGAVEPNDPRCYFWMPKTGIN